MNHLYFYRFVTCFVLKTLFYGCFGCLKNRQPSTVFIIFEELIKIKWLRYAITSDNGYYRL